MEFEAFGTRSRRLDVGIIGTAISSPSAAWLLAKHHDVTVFEARDWIGGHCNTITFKSESGDTAVDTGFIVYNEVTYSNLTALFDVLSVPTAASNMSFAPSLNGGQFEYSARRELGLFAQWSTIAIRRFLLMMRDLLRFYRYAPALSLSDCPSRNGLIPSDWEAFA